MKMLSVSIRIIFKMFVPRFRVTFGIILIIFLNNQHFSQANTLNTIGNLFQSGKNITQGVITDVGNLLPTPKGLFEGGKDLLAGYPFEFVATAVNSVCSSALANTAIAPKVTPDVNKMQFQLRTACNKYSFPLTNADEMWKSPEFDSKKKVVILATGWTTTVNESSTIDELAKAYNCRGDVNFVAVDAAQYVDTLYTWSAFNTEEIGQNIGKGLVQLSKIVPIENIHLIGHSLGAHIVGAAARTFNEVTDKKIPRITGLDPAKPCFNEGEKLSGLLRGDADFIDVIHSNPGVLGKRDPIGDIDFYPGGLGPLPPGCLIVTCAHARAWQYYTESVYPGHEHNFKAQRCTSMTKLREGKCTGKSYPMGYATPKDLKGNYILEVNNDEPYGVDAKGGGAKPTESKCGQCVNNQKLKRSTKRSSSRRN